MRIGINIPKELHQQLQPLKETMNISQICREALEAHLEKYEQSVEWLESDIAKQLVAKICEEELERKAMVEVDWEMLGYQDGNAWVQAATIFDWEYWCSSQNDAHGQNTVWTMGRPVHYRPGKVTFTSPEGVNTFHKRHSEYSQRIHEQSDEFLNWMHEEYDGMSPVYDFASAERDYGRGWMAHTTAAWEMICRLREEYSTKWHQERMQAHQNRPQPEVPDHLLADAWRMGITHPIQKILPVAS